MAVKHQHGLCTNIRWVRAVRAPSTAALPRTGVLVCWLAAVGSSQSVRRGLAAAALLPSCFRTHLRPGQMLKLDHNICRHRNRLGGGR